MKNQIVNIVLKSLAIGSFVMGILFFSQQGVSAQTLVEEGDFKAGIGLLYGSGVFADTPGSDAFQNDLGIHADAYYTFTPNIRAGGGVGYFFPKTQGSNSASVVEANLNANYIFVNEADMMVYGLAGINAVNVTQKDEEETVKISETGVNIGAGLEYLMDFGLVFAEVKLGNVGGNAGQTALSSGIRISL